MEIKLFNFNFNNGVISPFELEREGENLSILGPFYIVWRPKDIQIKIGQKIGTCLSTEKIIFGRK